MVSHHLSIQDVSTMTGISRNTISQLYNGKSRGIQFDTLSKLCDCLDCTPNDLIKLVYEDYTYYIPDNISVKKSSSSKCFYQIFVNLVSGSALFNNGIKGCTVSIGFWKIKNEASIIDIVFGIPFFEDKNSMEIYNNQNSEITRTSNILKNLTIANRRQLAKKTVSLLSKKYPELFDSSKSFIVGFKSEQNTKDGFTLELIRI